ncbi:PH domain-containing protein [Myxococcota bacterium]|nr:PH domain-containing protein [Myxococcota bacterium]MBU1534472.1 PH domain-containing protein [Myxococcota bacterium]
MTELDNPLVPDASTPEDKLPEEKLIWEGCPKWQADFGFIVKSFAIMILGLVLMIIFLAKGWLTSIPAMYRVIFFLAISSIGLGMFTWIRLKRKNERYKITNLNLEFEEGILSKTCNNMEMWRIRDIKYTQSFLDRILGVSRVTLYTQDTTTPELNLIGLPKDKRTYEDIKKAFLVAKQRRNVIGMVE